MLTVAGCMSTHRDDSTYRSGSEILHKPVVAVLVFENRSGFRGKWNLGDGMADLLVTHLLDSGRFTVIERRQLEAMISEIRMQDADLFRPEGRAAAGRLKNAQYLVRGVVTDFTVTGDGSGWFAKDGKSVKLMGSSARVGINLMILEVETGEVLGSVEADGSAGAFGIGGAAKYQDLAFGSEAFFRTPLGKAAGAAMREAIVKIQRTIPPRPWRPRVAEVHGNAVIVSGGENLRIRVGDSFIVRGAPHNVTDPTTGNVIQSVPGPEKGRLSIIAVQDRSSNAQLVSGAAVRGDTLYEEIRKE